VIYVALNEVEVARLVKRSKEEVGNVIDFLGASDVNEITTEVNGLKIKVSRVSIPSEVPPRIREVASSKDVGGCDAIVVKSPYVGKCELKVSEGDMVTEKETVIAIIEPRVGDPQEVKATASGRISKILAGDSELFSSHGFVDGSTELVEVDTGLRLS